jgi:HD-like signal output (HDOD) protein
MNLQQLIDIPNVLPSIPRVISKVLSELNTPEPDLRKIGMQLKDDPVMTARLLAIANSVRFNLSRGVSTVAEALPLLGLDELRDMIYTAAMVSAFRQIGGVNMQQFWCYSLNTAKLTRKLAADTPYVSAAYTVGLVHAAGELVMHQAMPEEMAKLDASVPVFDPRRAEAEVQLLGYSYAQVGAVFAQAWSMPRMLVDVLGHHADPTAPTSREPLAGVLHLAVWRARAREVRLGLEALAATFPKAIASALGLDGDHLLGEQIIDWTSMQEVSGYT